MGQLCCFPGIFRGLSGARHRKGTRLNESLFHGREDPEVERQEWVRDVINEDGFADAIGSTEADQVRKNFDTDFPKMEYSNPGGLCACGPIWHPGGQGASAPGVVGPLMPGAPLGPTPMPAMPGIPAYQPMPAPYFI